MTKKSLLLTGALALSTLSIASAKTYDIVISQPATAGNVELRKGEYRLKLEGTNAVLTDVNNGKKVTVPVKIETAAQKHEQTAVDLNTEGGTSKVTAIELGGSNETLEFGGL